MPLSEPARQLETRLLWRSDDPSPALQAFRSIAQTIY